VGQVYGHFKTHLEASKSEKNPSGHLAKALSRALLPAFLWSGVLKLAWAALEFAGPLLLEALLANMESPDGDYRLTIGLSCAIFAASAAAMLLNNMAFHVSFRVGMHTKIATIHLVYEKLSSLSLAAKSKLGSGMIANLQSNDTMKLWMLPQFLHSIWIAPLQIIVFMGLLIRIIGFFPTLAGLAVTVSLIPLSTVTGKALAKVRRKVVQLTDRRVKVVSEVVGGIKAIKLYAWEEPYKERLCGLRNVELAQVKKAALLQGVNMIIFSSSPILISIATFGVYAALGKRLLPSVAFPALSLFNLLRFPILMLPMQITNIINAKVSHKRLQDFISLEETEGVPRSPPAAPGETAVRISDGSFAWQLGAESPTLDGVNLSVAAGELIMVVGEVGCGKSTLLQSVLGETVKLAGEAEVRGSVAYTNQDPWIQNMTLRDNVLFGLPYSADRYDRTVEACGLLPDMKILSAGDMTEIGEKGINLSGGQKHRVALARAVYADADVYLLDDPLSAVDAHVGSHLFNNCICGVLSGKARILVTHQLQFLPQADKIAVMRGGRIESFGSYDELVEQGIDFQRFAELTAKEEDDAEESGAGPNLGVTGAEVPPVDEAAETHGEPSGSDADPDGTERASEETDSNSETDRQTPEQLPSAADLKQNCSVGMRMEKSRSLGRAGSLVLAERRAEGRVKLRLYLTYVASWGPLFILPVLLILSAGAERGLQQIQNWWLNIWSENAFGYTGTAASNDMRYVGIFFALGLGSLLASLVRVISMVQGTVSASSKMHRMLLDTVLALPMSFYDTQPTGRLINRFTKDVEAMDVQLGQSIGAFLVCAISFAASLVVVCTVAPWFLIAIIPLGVAYWYIQHFYIQGSREMKRLDSVSFSPIFNHFGETLSGLTTIRAFGLAGSFVERNMRLLATSNRCWWPLQVANRWLGTRLELLGISVVFVTALLTAVFAPVSAGLAGLALTSAMSMTSVLNFMVRQSSELEINMNAVERILDYESEGKEAAPVVPGNRPPESWPSHGIIEASELYVRYREELDPVLKGISFLTEAFEKIGIAGRTGCGKSTLMMTLYRIVEPTSGGIWIDGVDTRAIGLRDLRSRLALVPQDPVVFSGTVRSNLDPFSQFTDEELWGSLRKVSMVEAVEQFDGKSGLDSTISESGGNLSVGQRQLLGLARALLRNARILVLDEATSNIDNTTDELIQATIKESFAECTVLTIAHRLHTIMHSDRIMVLDNGRLKEFDTPRALLKVPHQKSANLC